MLTDGWLIAPLSTVIKKSMYVDTFGTIVTELDEFDVSPEAPLKFTTAVTPNPFTPPSFVKLMRITKVVPAM